MGVGGVRDKTLFSKDFLSLGYVLGTQTPCLKKQQVKNCVWGADYSVKDLGQELLLDLQRMLRKFQFQGGTIARIDF